MAVRSVSGWSEAFLACFAIFGGGRGLLLGFRKSVSITSVKGEFYRDDNEFAGETRGKYGRGDVSGAGAGAGWGYGKGDGSGSGRVSGWGYGMGCSDMGVGRGNGSGWGSGRQ